MEKEKIDYKEIVNNIKGLRVVFGGESKKQIWTKDHSTVANLFLKRIASQTGTFESTSENEAEKIEEDLVVIDGDGKKVELVNINGMKESVGKVLNENDFYSILRTLAVTNKCAHQLDNNYKNLFKEFKGKSLKLFSLKLKQVEYSELKTDKEQLDESIAEKIKNFSIEDMKKFLEDLDVQKSKEEAEKEETKRNRTKEIAIKKDILQKVGVNIPEKSNLDDIREKIDKLKANRGKILESYLQSNVIKEVENIRYLIRDFEIAEYCRDSLFEIKDELIVQIAQLLKNQENPKKQENCLDLSYELVKTNDNGKFDYMLAINYPELAYYIEVHMPNYIAKKLMDEYSINAVESSQRSFERLGASAVFDRKEDEVKKIQSTQILEGEIRKQILTRSMGNLANKNRDNPYKFETDKFIEILNTFEAYLYPRNMNEIKYDKDKFEESLDKFEVSSKDENIVDGPDGKDEYINKDLKNLDDDSDGR